MAPTNYKRPKAIFTKKMVEQAEKELIELGLENSLGRRHATLDDITVNNVLYINRDAKKVKKSVFDDLKDEASVNPKKFNKVAEVTIEDFVEKILPTATNIELMMENKHSANLMSLVAPQDSDAPTMFKWDNNFSWSYNGDITDSMKENVKAAGGKVDGALRFSIQWNETGEDNQDLDAHCDVPGGGLIYYGNKRCGGGQLDVDIQSPGRSIAVENITWDRESDIKEGRYGFKVHNFSGTNRRGFRAEIEYNGEVHSFDYPNGIRTKDTIIVAEIKYSKANGIEFISSLGSTITSKEIWNIKSNSFVKVNSMMYSPNYWDNQNGAGNKHFFFFLEGCKSDTPPRGFYNEFLKDSLMPHKRVFEALGGKMRVEESDNQLSGVGFSTTKRNSVIAKVDGHICRVIKINF
jgi:hypothetical protein